jgi:hypothetical protein
MKRGVPDDDDNEEVNRIKKRKGRRMGIAFPHVCEQHFCHPENDDGNVFVCDYGSVHVCSAETCELASVTERGEWVCPLSGLVLSVNDDEPAMYRTDEGQFAPLGWKLIKTNKKKKKTKNDEDDSASVIEQRARVVLEALFFGRARLAINRAHAKKQRDKQQQVLQRYIQEQTREQRFVSLPHIYCISANTVCTPAPYTILDRNTHKSAEHIERCVHVIVQVWNKLVLPLYAIGKHTSVTEAPSRPHVDQCIFGVLALMVVGHELVHHDAWVSKHLPPEQDMSEFRISHVKRKLAKNTIARFYELAKQNGIFPVMDPFVRLRQSLSSSSSSSSTEPMVFQPVSRGFYCKVCRIRTPTQDGHQRCCK